MIKIDEHAALSSATDFLNVRREMRAVIAKLLSSMGTSMLLLFGVLALLEQQILLGGTLLAFSAVALLGFILLVRGSSDAAITSAWTFVTAGICVALVYTGGSEHTGLYWVYPCMLIGVLVNRFWIALAFCLFCWLSSGLMLLTPISELLAVEYTSIEVSRYLITIVITGFCGLVYIFFDDRSHQHMVNLHDNVTVMASRDPLTGLANRRSFRQWLLRLLSRGAQPDKAIALLYIDIDDFKQMNDRHGHMVGDRILEVFSERLAELVRASDGAARLESYGLSRLAGDEFAVVLTDLAGPDQAELVAERLLQMCEAGIEVDDESYRVSASIGIALYPHDGDCAETLLHHADAAMYQAKRSGKNRYHFFTRAIADGIEERKRIEDGLRDALAHQTFSLVYMPMFDCKTLELVGVEVLLRTHEPKLAGIGPDRFIPVAEATGLIKEIDNCVIEQALRKLKQIQQSHGFDGLFCINISAVELHNREFPSRVAALLKEHKIDPGCVELELTETSLMVDDDESIAVLAELKALGLSLALDDFGTGYTAFNQLSSYPVDCLKIDRSFVNDLFSEQQSKQKMVPIIQSLAGLYDLRVIAEGVETEEQLEYLKRSGCHWAQGYHLSKPLPWDAFMALVEEHAASNPRELESSSPDPALTGAYQI